MSLVSEKFCAAKCRAENGQIILMVTIYISPNQRGEKIVEFIHKNLVAYTEAGSTLLNKLPVTLSGDFNVDFSKDKSKLLVDFLKSKFNLIMSNDPNESTTKLEKKKTRGWNSTNDRERGRVAIYRPFGEVSLSLNRTVTCTVLKANDRRTSCPCHDEFRGPRSDYVRQVALATPTTTTRMSVRAKQ
ncbi:uncharacterized protein TNCV_1605291 [Trichonephila clavipes]|nr:uncharacterized protein TNCV_1605291 [Trichonephila clavipes]